MISSFSRLIYKILSILALLTLLFFIIIRLLDPSPDLFWYGRPWFAHTDHWHIFYQVDSFVESFLTPDASDTIYSRLPSIFPDLFLAFLSKLAFSVNGLAALKLFLVLKFLLLFLSISIVFLLVVNDNILCLLLSSLSLCLIHYLWPSSLFVYVPIHHGGNIINSLLTIFIYISIARPTLFSKHIPQSFYPYILSVLILLSCLSNRLYVFTVLLPICIDWFFFTSNSPWLSTRRIHRISVAITGIILAFLIRPPLMQGRDSISNISQSISYLQSLLSVSHAVKLFLVLVFALILVYYILLKKSLLARGEILFQLTRLSLLSSFFSLVAALVIATSNQTLDLTRYLFTPIFICTISLVLLFSRLFQFIPIPSKLFISMLVTLLLALNTPTPSNLQLSLLNYNRNLLQLEFSILQTIHSSNPQTRYGLATSPPWHASVLTSLSNSHFTIREASSDGNPLFWHLWKGSYIHSSSKHRLARTSQIQTSDVLPFSFVLTGPEESTKINAFFGSPKRSIYCPQVGYKCLHLYDTSDNLISNIVKFINTYGPTPKS